MIDHGWGEAGVGADPESASHDDVRVGEVADDAEIGWVVGGLAEDVPGEHQAGADLAFVQVAQQVFPVDGVVGVEGDGEPEP